MRMPPVLPPAIQLLPAASATAAQTSAARAGASKTAAKTSETQAASVPVMQVRQSLRRQRRKRRQPHRGSRSEKHLRQTQQSASTAAASATAASSSASGGIHPPPHLIPAHLLAAQKQCHCCRSSSHQSRRCRKTGERRHCGRIDFTGRRCQPDEKGIVKLSSATDSDSEALAAAKGGQSCRR